MVVFRPSRPVQWCNKLVSYGSTLLLDWVRTMIVQLYSASEFIAVPQFLAIDSIHFNVWILLDLPTIGGISVGYCWFTFAVAVVITGGIGGVFVCLLFFYPDGIDLSSFDWTSRVPPPNWVVRTWTLDQRFRAASFPCLLNPLLQVAYWFVTWLQGLLLR